MDDAIRWHQDLMGLEFLDKTGRLKGKDMHRTGVLGRYGIKLDDYVKGTFEFSSGDFGPRANCGSISSSRRGLIVFDLDGCLWNFTAET